MMFVKFKANAFQVEMEDGQIFLNAAVKTKCGRVVESVEIALPKTFQYQFTELENQKKEEQDLAEIEAIYLKRQQYQN